VRVESEVDHGSTFTVTIPLGAAHLPADRVEAARRLTSTGLRGEVYVEEALRWLPGTQNADLGTRDGARLADGADTAPHPAHFAFRDSPPRILLADDNADMREYVGRLLSRRYEVEAVSDGLEALNAARERTPDLVLTDVMMPRLDGFGLLKELRSDERLKTVPVILLSARAGEEASVEGIDSGADDYLIKPFSARELVARVDAHLKMAGLRAEGEKALRESEAKLAIELADSQQLQHISSSLIRDDNIDVLYDEVLDAARSLMRSDMASIQWLSRERNELFLLAQHGFAPESAKFWEWVQAEDTTSCGVALARGEPVIVPDVELWDFVAGTEDLAHYRLSGIRAMLSTPLISRNGRLVGVMSTHWREVHQPSERELRLLDVLARQAADLIERRTAEEALRESEKKYRTLFDSIDEGFCTIEVLFDENERAVDYRFLQVSPSFERQTGIINAPGRRMREIAPQQEEYWFEIYGRVALTGEPIRFERGAKELGNRFYDVYAFRVEDPQLRRVGILFNDITERKRHERRQEFLLKLSDALRPLHDAVEIQARACQILGEQMQVDRAYFVEVSEAENYARVREHYGRSDSPSMVGAYRLADYGWSVPIMRRDETIVFADVHHAECVPPEYRPALLAIQIVAHIAVPLVRGGVVVGVLCVTEPTPRAWTADEVNIMREVADRLWATAERARAEEALRRAHEELEQKVLERTRELRDANAKLQTEIIERKRSEAARAELLQRLVTAQEDERRRISRELHDTLGQYLTALQFELQMVKGLDGCPADVAEGITKMRAAALEMDEEVERLSFELRPLALDDLGLEDALRRHVQEWAASSGIAVDLHAKNLDHRRLPAHVESTVYRVVQEALTNVRRHAEATRVSLIVERRRKELLAIIEDDGRGFDLEAVSGSAGGQRKLGLMGMLERAALVGGNLDVETEPGAGATGYLRIPLDFDQGDGGSTSHA